MPKIDAEQASILDEAVRLHRAGWWVVPQNGKRAVALGWDRWRLSEEDLASYLGGGGLNIAVLLSAAEVMDVETDSAEAESRVRAMLDGGAATPTWRSKRGFHRLFLRPQGLPDRAKIEVEGVEFRIGNKPALSTVPPSVHPDGGAYRWEPGLSWEEVTPSPLPPKLARLLEKGVKAVSTGGPSHLGNGQAEGPGLLAEGQRNEELFRAGCRLLRAGLDPADIRNFLAGANADRCKPPLPPAEVEGIARSVEQTRARREAAELGPAECRSWRQLEDSWRSALLWTDQLSQALAVCLAVCISTEQQGDNQLFLQLIADAGSAKTKLCDGLLVAKRWCYPLEHLTGFHSGWKDSSGDDFSLLSRINNMTLITPEGDVLMSSPRFVEIMSQQRRIFDGTSGAEFKNRKEPLRWEGLRTPWIMAGTPALLATDQSRLGDRFIRFIIDPPDADRRRDILRHVGFRELRTVRVRCNGVPESVVEENLLAAYRLTGGYVDWLRTNAEELLGNVVAGDAVVERCADLAEFAADFRARPDMSNRIAERHDTKELPSRLTGQFVRLSCCLAAVLNRAEVDDECLRVVRKVAVDTARGRTLDIAKLILAEGAAGLEARTVAGRLGEGEDRMLTLLRFMRKIGVLQLFDPPSASNVALCQRWRLTPRVERLCKEVL